MKKILFLVTICLFLMGGKAFAHTGLESSNPSDGSTITDPIEEITLTFLTKIEQTSSFEVHGPNNTEVPVKDIVVVDDIMTGTVDGLDNGEYTLTWNIIGADGHPINGDVSFTVNLPAVEAPEQEIDQEEEKVVEKSAPIDEESDVASDSSSSNFFTWAIILLVIVLAASVWWINGRKKK